MSYEEEDARRRQDALTHNGSCQGHGMSYHSMKRRAQTPAARASVRSQPCGARASGEQPSNLDDGSCVGPSKKMSAETRWRQRKRQWVGGVSMRW